jgi:DNA replication protein DnaC
MLDMLRAAYKSHEFDRRFADLRNGGLLVLDDLATEQGTPWVVAKLYQIVNHRYPENLPLIVTNLNTWERPAQIYGRILSRLLEWTDRKDRRCRLWVSPAGDYGMGKRG